MELVYVALPVALVIAGAALAAFVWAARDDQFEDLDTPARRALFEDLPVEGRTQREAGKAGEAAARKADGGSGGGKSPNSRG